MSGDRISRRGLIATGGALITLPNISWAGASALTVEAPSGQFIGTQDANRVRSFRGIRYGRAERFQAPRPVERSNNPVVCDAFGPVAPQKGDRYGPQSEDCLFLNIWAPAPTVAAKLPVMVYIHGGAYSGGSVTDPLNDGATLGARGDVVVVTINHRLNAFGYLYLARLDPQFPDSGNAGQLDLILALQWVRDNIAAFGGDPARVMVFGQSGGGAKIATMMGMPAAKGLFHGAATMSGQQVTASGPLNATERSRAFLARLGVKENDLSPLLSLPVQKLVEALDATDPIIGGGVYFGPVFDMKWLMRHPFWPDANPQSNAIPMLLGNTHDETRGFISLDSPKIRGLSWDNLAGRMEPELRIDVLPEWVVAEYRAQFPSWSPMEVFYGATTAGRSWRGQVIEAERRAEVKAPTWVYQVDYRSRTNPLRGAFHTMDIPLVFGTLTAAGSETGDAADAQLASRTLQERFVAFAKTGSPDHRGQPHWPQYDLGKRATLIVDAPPRIIEDPRKWERELFARVPYIQPGT
jgi:para-nitrobenzyl esterase